MFKLKIHKIILLMIALISLNSKTYAAPIPPDISYLTALASYAAYNDQEALHLRQVIRKEGWDISEVMADHPQADVKYLLLTKEVDQVPYYIIAIAGTSSFQDVKTDLNYHSVGFNPLDTLSHYNLTINEKALPRVHKGFNNYVIAGFFHQGQSIWSKKIIERLQTNPQSQLIITGHSLGGAVATILAARLIDLGVNSQQIHVFTYGAPAVGNEPFVAKYEPAMDLHRITMQGDGVKNLAQIANKQLVQFKSNEVWHYPYSSLGKYRHSMALYLDVAMEKYWQVKLAALSPAEQGAVAKIAVSLPEEFAYYKPYLQYAIYQILGAKSLNYQFNFQCHLEQNSKNGNYKITGEIISSHSTPSFQSAMKTTDNITILEAMVYIIYSLLLNI